MTEELIDMLVRALSFEDRRTRRHYLCELLWTGDLITPEQYHEFKPSADISSSEASASTDISSDETMAADSSAS
jgi:hypothetical protein